MEKKTVFINGIQHVIMPRASTEHIQQKYLDLAYAQDSETQKLDLYLPNRQNKIPFPLIVFAHGGAFTYGKKDDDQLNPILGALDRGYAVASIEYRKSDEARFPAMVYDAKAAIRYLRAHADSYNLDIKRFAGWGPSSGGWLMSMVGVTTDNPAFEDKSMGYAGFSSSVQATVDWCGPCGGFLNMDKAFVKSRVGEADHNDIDSPESRFLGTQITRVPELDRMACPCSYVSKNTAPVLVVHGGIDQVVPVEQSKAFFNELQSVSSKHQLFIAEGKLHHGAEWYNEQWVTDMCLDFLDKVLLNVS